MKSVCLQLLVVVMVVSGCSEAARVQPLGIVGWPMKGGNTGRTWQGSDLDLRNEPQLVWHKTGVRCDDMVADGKRLFVSDGGISAYDLATGSTLWSSPETQADLIAVHGKQVICVSRTHMVSLHADTGSLVWRRGAPWVKSPLYWNVRPDTLLSDGSWFYVACSSGEVLAFDAADGKLIWGNNAFEGTYATNTRRVLIALQGEVVIVSARRAEVVALRSENGQVMWRKTPEKAGGVSAGLALTRDGRWLQASQGYLINRPYDTLHAYSPNGPRKCWRSELKREQFDLGRYAQEHIATDGARAYFVRQSAEQELWCLDLRNGGRLWAFRPGQDATSLCCPVVSGGTVLVASSDGHLYGVSAKDGSLLWTTSFAAERDRSDYAVVVAGSHIVIADSQDIWVFTLRGDRTQLSASPPRGEGVRGGRR